MTKSDRPASELTDELDDVDVVLTGSDDPVAASRILLRQPRALVLAVLGEGRETLLYDLRPHRTILGEVSPGQLVEEIRGRRRPTPQRQKR